MTDAPEIRRKTYRLYGRAKAKPLTARQQRLVDEALPKIAVDPKDPMSVMQAYAARRLEIGFGGGEHLAYRAAESPDVGFMGVEPFVNGVAKLLVEIEERGLSNVRLHQGDVRDLLPHIPDGAFDQIDILYPDPWPKKRHNKRRLVSDMVTAELHRIIAPGGILRFASDIPDYVDWALIRILRHGGFDWRAAQAADWQTPYPGWPGTRYEDKALKAGRVPAYLQFFRKPG